LSNTIRRTKSISLSKIECIPVRICFGRSAGSVGKIIGTKGKYFIVRLEGNSEDVECVPVSIEIYTGEG